MKKPTLKSLLAAFITKAGEPLHESELVNLAATFNLGRLDSETPGRSISNALSTNKTYFTFVRKGTYKLANDDVRDALNEIKKTEEWEQWRKTRFRFVKSKRKSIRFDAEMSCLKRD